jgi:hypothetical protein
MIMGTIAGPAIQLIFGGQLLGDIVTPLGGAAQLARLAALVAAMFLLPDITSGAVVDWRRILALTLVLVIAASMVVQSACMCLQRAPGSVDSSPSPQF